MLRLFKTHYLKSRVIMASYHIDKVMTEYVKQGFEDPDEKFMEENPMKYYECNFLSHIVTRWQVDESRFTAGEKAKYDEAVKKLQHYRELKEFVTNMNEFYWELKTLYLEVQKEIATPNVWYRRDYTTNQFETETHDSLKKFDKLMNDLKDYPEWQLKVKEEIGYYIHLLYNSLNHQEGFKELFAEFDPQYYFK